MKLHSDIAINGRCYKKGDDVSIGQFIPLFFLFLLFVFVFIFAFPYIFFSFDGLYGFVRNFFRVQMKIFRLPVHTVTCQHCAKIS